MKMTFGKVHKEESVKSSVDYNGKVADHFVTYVSLEISWIEIFQSEQ